MRISDLDQAVIFVTLDDVCWSSIREESCVREDEVATLIFVEIRGYQMIYQPLE